MSIDKKILNNAFYEAHLKINRASRHIDEAISIFRGYVETDFCSFSIDKHTYPGTQQFRVAAAPLPADFIMAIGDAFHCLSCSFDYIMTGFMRAKGKSSTRVTFPSDETRHALRKSFMKPKPGKGAPANRRIVEAYPTMALLLLQTIKPYRGGNYGVWEIRRADNIDKHNILIPTANITRLEKVHVTDEANQVDLSFSVTVEAGLVSVPFVIGATNDFKIENEGQATVAITFADESEIFAGEPVIPTLMQARQFSVQAFHILRKYADSIL